LVDENWDHAVFDSELCDSLHVYESLAVSSHIESFVSSVDL
jgi:hypothetical protein